MRREIGINHTLCYRPHSNPDLFQGAWYVEAGKDFGWCNFLVQPFVGFEVDFFNHSRIHEHATDPSLNVSVNAKSQTTAASRLGMHITSLDVAYGFNVAVDTAWVYRLNDIHNNIREHFVDFGTPFIIKGLHISRSSFEGTINVSTNLTEYIQVFAEATGERWQRASSFSLLAGIQGTW
jgi:hypothetical protein